MEFSGAALCTGLIVIEPARMTNRTECGLKLLDERIGGK
jgi:hypothetical protein